MFLFSGVKNNKDEKWNITMEIKRHD